MTFALPDVDLGLVLNGIAILVLLLLSAFFSGTESALTAASRARMHQRARRGEARAMMVESLRESTERLIGTILIGNNLVNILASALATSVMIALFGDRGVMVATVAMTVLVVIFGEVLPKTYAINNADRAALAVAPIIRLLVRLLGPVTHTLTLVVQGTLGLLGIEARNTIGYDEREEELRGLIELHRGPDEETVQERAMLRSILDLGEVEVGEIMVHRGNVVMIDADLPPADILRRVLDSPHTRLPLWRGEPDNIVGLLHAKALLREVRAKGGDVDRLDVAAIASKPWFIPDTTTLLDQLTAFRRRREHFALVVDEYGTLMGIVTLEDILEEIVGQIDDEHDVALPGVRPQPDGSFLVQGTVTIRDLNREYDWSLPDDEASTLAGLLLHEARMIPEVGQEFVFYGMRFKVLRRQRNQITLIRVTRLGPLAEEADG